jgi:hypothetical protein
MLTFLILAKVKKIRKEKDKETGKDKDKEDICSPLKTTTPIEIIPKIDEML